MDALDSWVLRDLVISNKLNAVSNGLILANKAILGSYLHRGVLVCPFDDARQWNYARDYMSTSSFTHMYYENEEL